MVSYTAINNWNTGIHQYFTNKAVEIVTWHVEKLYSMQMYLLLNYLITKFELCFILQPKLLQQYIHMNYKHTNRHILRGASQSILLIMRYHKNIWRPLAWWTGPSARPQDQVQVSILSCEILVKLNITLSKCQLCDIEHISVLVSTSASEN